jgi:3-phenylpropionate/trans-cinnamate dioxygenase ferredoxin reductase component
MARHVWLVSPLESSDHVVVVGAGLAGWRFVEEIRQLGFQGAITLIGDERHAPYERPPLSKQILSGKWGLEKATLATPEKLDGVHATVLLGRRAVHLDADAKSVRLDDDSVVTGTHVVLATGIGARSLSFDSSGPLPTLRTFDDASRLNDTASALDSDSVVAVIGGGFIGAEVATSFQARGLRPVVLEMAERPLIGVVGSEASTWLHRLGPAAGIEVRTSQRVRDVTTNDKLATIHFENGEPLVARAVVAAVGSALDLEWLADSGVALDDGVVVDHYLEAAPRVAAIGDMARFVHRSGRDEEHVRLEHWQVAADHAWQLAHHWMGQPEEPALPYFWSDQYGKKIQMLGHPRPDDEVVMVEGSAVDLKWLALFVRDQVVTAVLTLSQPRGLALSRVLLDEVTTLDKALSLAPWAS